MSLLPCQKELYNRLLSGRVEKKVDYSFSTMIFSKAECEGLDHSKVVHFVKPAPYYFYISDRMYSDKSRYQTSEILRRLVLKCCEGCICEKQKGAAR